MAAYKVIKTKADMDKLFDETTNDAKRTELVNYVKCVAYNYDRFIAMTDLCAIDGYKLDGECCVPIDPKVIQQVMRDFVLIAIDMPKVNGKKNNWSSGGMGSRWLDMDAEEYGLDYIRCAFYSKKFSDKWNIDKPFKIVITCEKGR